MVRHDSCLWSRVFFFSPSLKRSLAGLLRCTVISERWRIEQLAVINIKQTFALRFARASARETEDDTHWEMTLERGWMEGWRDGRMEGWRALEGGVEGETKIRFLRKGERWRSKVRAMGRNRKNGQTDRQTDRAAVCVVCMNNSLSQVLPVSPVQSAEG